MYTNQEPALEELPSKSMTVKLINLKRYLVFILISVFFSFTFSSLHSEVCADSLYFKIKKVEYSEYFPVFYWDMNNKEFSSKDFTGKILFINFWATWCSPCVKEMPDLSELNSEFKDSGVIMIGISIFKRSGAPKLSDFLFQNPVTYLILEGNDEIVNQFGKVYGEEIDAIPATFIINKKGLIAERIIGLRSKDFYRNIINKYLNN